MDVTSDQVELTSTRQRRGTPYRAFETDHSCIGSLGQAETAAGSWPRSLVTVTRSVSVNHSRLYGTATDALPLQ
jgi:hypothetical protein